MGFGDALDMYARPFYSVEVAMVTSITYTTVLFVKRQTDSTLLKYIDHVASKSSRFEQAI